VGAGVRCAKAVRLLTLGPAHALSKKVEEFYPQGSRQGINGFQTGGKRSFLF
jgi:hypothetical protein